MSVMTPAYKAEFYNKAGGLRYGFGSGYNTKALSFSIKPGMTTAIGSFEVVLVDTGSDASGIATGVAFKDIDVYEPVYLYYGYTGSGMGAFPWYQFKGLIDTKKIEYTEGQCIRTYVGRDDGEALFRILERRSFTGSCSGSAVLLKDRAGLNASNVFIDNSTDVYNLVLSNDNCFKGLQEISDFNNKDFYVDTGSKLHWFERHSLTGAETFSVGTNIKSYRLFTDITDSKNDYFVFGMRDLAPLTGSDWPVNHDDWTQTETAGWVGWINEDAVPGIDNECVILSSSAAYATGSWSMSCFTGASGFTNGMGLYTSLTKTIPNGPVMCNPGDVLHFYDGSYILGGTNLNSEFRIRLQTNTNNYFECKLESRYNLVGAAGQNWLEYIIELGPSNEGISITGSKDTNTGSYKWTRVGSPDWYNINSVKLWTYHVHDGALGQSTVYIDGLYIGTRFQYRSGSTGSQIAYNYRPEVVIDSKYNSNLYCKNVAQTLLAQNSGSTTQVELLTTGSPNLQIGNKHAITIPAENLNSTYLELIDLEHIFNNDGYTVKCLFTDKPQLRIPIPIINYPVQVFKFHREFDWLWIFHQNEKPYKITYP